MKILITGGAGYIGSSICNLLKDKNNVVEIYDLFKDGSQAVNNFINNKNYIFTKADIRDEQSLKKSLQSSDVIIHLAAIVGFPACDSNPYEALSINVEGTKILCKNISKNQRVIFSSTGAAYGKVDGICDESTPLNPSTLYSRTKSEGEKIVQEINGVILRLATLYGVSNKSRDDLLINNLFKDAIKNKCITLFEGHAIRTFLEVNEAARCFLLAVEGAFDSQGILNVGDSKNNFRKGEVAKKICELTNAHLFSENYNMDPDFRDYEVSYSKVKKLGFISELDFDESLKSLKKYYEVN